MTPTLLTQAVRAGNLSRARLLQGLNSDDTARLLETARWKRLERGTTLTLRGSHPPHAWLLLCGFVKEHRPLADGTDAVCAFRGPGDLVGEAAALTGRPADSDATLLTPGEALALSTATLCDAARSSRFLQLALMRTLADRATTAEDAIARRQQADLHARVASAVLSLAETWGVATTAGVRVGLPLTQAELASWLGVSRETAAKALAQLRASGTVSTSRRRLIIHDMERLRRVAGPDGDTAWIRAS